MHPVNLIASAIRGKEDCPELPGSQSEGICCVTGDICQTIDRKELFGKSFTNIDSLIAPQSERIGIDAYLALSYKWERMSCWICDGKEFMRLQRTEFRPLVLDGVDYPIWSANITTSYKKHGAFGAKINTGRGGIWRFENQIVDARDLDKNREWFSVMDKELRSGVGRSIIETLDMPAYLLSKLDFKQWMEFEKWARPKYQSPLYQFLCYFLPSQEELKNEIEKRKGNDCPAKSEGFLF